jgi:hypothetical protein
MTARRPSRRLVTGLVVAALVGGSAVGAEAATKKKPVVKRITRTVVLKYTGGCTVELNAGGTSAAGAPGACTNVGAANFAQSARSKEKYLTVKVADSTGRAVPGQVWIKGSGVAKDTEVAFCGAMKSYRMAAPDFTLDLDAIGAVANCPGTATSGTITLVYSNLP